MAPRKKRRRRRPTDDWLTRVERMKKNARSMAAKRGLKEGYRSGLEVKTAEALCELVPPEVFSEEDFESLTLPWQPLPTQHNILQTSP